jgi:hypothetical protein
LGAARRKSKYFGSAGAGTGPIVIEGRGRSNRFIAPRPTVIETQTNLIKADGQKAANRNHD